MDYEKLGRRELKKIQMCNPPDVPHYKKALDERKRRDRRWMLIVTCTATLLTVISLLFGLAHTFAAQVKQERWQHLLTMNQQFENYKTDFKQLFQTSRSSQNEDMIDLQLVGVADHTVVHLEYIQTIMAIYLKVSSKQDRLAIWPLITDQMDYTRKRLDLQIEMVNVSISAIRRPGVVAEAMHMRDDLRQVEEDLDGTRKEIEVAEAKLP
jgi:hypothetical protein